VDNSRTGKRRTQGEGSVYYDAARGRWIGLVWVEGKRRKVVRATRIDAAAAVGRLLHGVGEERKADTRATVRTLLAEWSERALPNRPLAPSSRAVSAWASRHLVAELGSIRLVDLGVVDVEKALARLAAGSQGAPLGPASLTKVRGTLRMALSWAMRRRAVSYNAAAVAELPVSTSGRTERLALDAKQLRALFAECEGHPHGAMFVVAGSCGLRPGEAAGLCDDAIDLEAGTLTVMRAVRIVKGRPVLVSELKTAVSRRTVRLPAVARAALAARSRVSLDGLLFTAGDGGPLSPSTVRRELAGLCRDAGIPVIRPNELRHTCATLLVEAGLPLVRVADILGHRSTSMLDRVYRHRPPTAEGGDVLDALL
jgi:integrase